METEEIFQSIANRIVQKLEGTVMSSAEYDAFMATEAVTHPEIEKSDTYSYGGAYIIGKTRYQHYQILNPVTNLVRQGWKYNMRRFGGRDKSETPLLVFAKGNETQEELDSRTEVLVAQRYPEIIRREKQRESRHQREDIKAKYQDSIQATINSDEEVKNLRVKISATTVTMLKANLELARINSQLEEVTFNLGLENDWLFTKDKASRLEAYLKDSLPSRYLVDDIKESTPEVLRDIVEIKLGYSKTIAEKSAPVLVKAKQEIEKYPNVEELPLNAGSPKVKEILALRRVSDKITQDIKNYNDQLAVLNTSLELRIKFCTNFASRRVLKVAKNSMVMGL